MDIRIEQRARDVILGLMAVVKELLPPGLTLPPVASEARQVLALIKDTACSKR